MALGWMDDGPSIANVVVVIAFVPEILLVGISRVGIDGVEA